MPQQELINEIRRRNPTLEASDEEILREVAERKPELFQRFGIQRPTPPPVPASGATADPETLLNPPPPTGAQGAARSALATVGRQAPLLASPNPLLTFGMGMAGDVGAQALGLEPDDSTETGANIGEAVMSRILQRVPGGAAANTLMRRLSRGAAARAGGPAIGATIGANTDLLFNPDGAVEGAREIDLGTGASVFLFGLAGQSVGTAGRLLTKGAARITSNPQVRQLTKSLVDVARKEGINVEEGFGSTGLALGSRLFSDPALSKVTGVQRQLTRTVDAIFPSRLTKDQLLGGTTPEGNFIPGIASTIKGFAEGLPEQGSKAFREELKRFNLTIPESRAIRDLASLDPKSISRFFTETFGTRANLKTEAIGAVRKIISDSQPELAQQLTNEWIKREFFARSIVTTRKAGERISLGGKEGLLSPSLMRQALNDIGFDTIDDAFGSGTANRLKQFSEIIEFLGEPKPAESTGGTAFGEAMQYIPRRLAWVFSMPGVFSSAGVAGAGLLGGAQAAASTAGGVLGVMGMVTMTRIVLDRPNILPLVERAVTDRTGAGTAAFIRAIGLSEDKQENLPPQSAF